MDFKFGGKSAFVRCTVDEFQDFFLLLIFSPICRIFSCNFSPEFLSDFFRIFSWYFSFSIFSQIFFRIFFLPFFSIFSNIFLDFYRIYFIQNFLNFKDFWKVRKIAIFPTVVLNWGTMTQKPKRFICHLIALSIVLFRSSSFSVLCVVKWLCDSHSQRDDLPISHRETEPADLCFSCQTKNYSPKKTPFTNWFSEAELRFLLLAPISPVAKMLKRC